MERTRFHDHPTPDDHDHTRHEGEDIKMSSADRSKMEEVGRSPISIIETNSWKNRLFQYNSISQTGTASMPGRRRQAPTIFASLGYLLVIITCLWIKPTSAVFIEFQNCLSESYQNDAPKHLQLVPMFVNAVFNTSDPTHNLNVTVYTNVAGSTTGKIQYVLPSQNDTGYWNNPNQTMSGGKIINNPFPETVAKYTTLDNKVSVLTYQPYNYEEAFCGALEHGAACPLSPVFTNSTDPHAYPSFGFSNNFYSSYAFTSFTATILVKYGDDAATPVGCISASITPDLGTTLSAVVKYIPVMILIFVAFATAFAAIYCPWGTTDTFRWTTNFGRDADLLRLVTPGFGDCLQYIQFVALTGGLSLNYPGFYQPIVSKVAWSALMFNQSFVSNTYSNSLIDGMYVTNGSYGMDRYRQLVGMGSVRDVWAGMAIWLMAILAAVVVAIQIGFFVRWIYRHIKNNQEEDLRAKNFPFSVGNVIRIAFNYFLLPMVALTMFQLVVISGSPPAVIACTILMLLVIFCFAALLLWKIASTRPKSVLFDDLGTLLKYGSLYNTYSDDAAPFALIPYFLTFLRGVAIGAIQPSGIAQLVLLAICEVITVLTLHAFRPFHSPTSMNAFHTFFAVLRFATILLMISFAPSLGVTEGPKGWIGYAILLMHAIVLICGFMLNALQTVVEVAARLAGAGGDESGATRGGLVKVFGMRQLSRRLPRRDVSRQSQLSNAAILDTENDRKSYILDNGRLRSQSAGSAGVLLNRQSMGLDSVDAFGAIPSHQLGSAQGSYTPTTPGETSTFSFLPSAAVPSGLGRNRGPILGLATAETSDPYYRPPRFRRPTLEAYSPGARSRASWTSGDWGKKRMSQADIGSPEQLEEGPSISGRTTPIEPPLALDGSPNEPRRTQADYTTREVDFYYGVRGPALNANIPSRRIKTGPADPTGIPASAAGWFKGLFGGKTKEKGKGFEVVRSSRVPPGPRNRLGVESPPEGIPVATGATRNGPIDSDDDEPFDAAPSASNLLDTQGLAAGDIGHDTEDALVSPLESDEDEGEEDDDYYNVPRISEQPPNLSNLDIPEGGIELPSRFPSKATSRASSRRARDVESSLLPDVPNRMLSKTPSVPRKSSRRQSHSMDISRGNLDMLRSHRMQVSVDSSSRMPFERTNSSRKRQSDISTRSGVTEPSLGHSISGSSVNRPTSLGHVNHAIRTINPSENQYQGSSAEVVDERHSGASSIEHNRQ